MTAALHVAGAVVAYRLHDVGYALDLERAARLVEGQATGRLRPALALCREDAWRLGLARKLQIFRDTYAMLNDEAQTARGNVLEVIIILLIVTEVILGLVHH